ncbi:MAG TPA: ABC transporter ATP-binding protein [Thermoanaerobaculia bacterium]|nr:ABC transporter ATP-binding protein [Thermoanaerobaculia bacterium]
MTSTPAIHARGLGKCYRLYRRAEDRLRQALFPRRGTFVHEHWALRGVDLTVERGRTVGVVGRNGSGKSTLLELVAGSLRPTTGELRVEGRVAAILELGSAMNPEFTGRENARLLAAVAGLGRAEIERRLEEILGFADIGEFVDQPVKVYSSGMLLRIAIAVALAVEPDVLVVDEVLAVGDEPFQRKCFARLEALRRRGATVLFASHDATTVMSLCDAVLLLDRGEALLYGEPKHVIERYLQLAFAPTETRDELRAEIRGLVTGADRSAAGPGMAARAAAAFDPELRSQSAVHLGPNGAEILDPRLETAAGERVNVLVRGEAYRYRYRVRFDAEHRRVRFGMLVKTKTGFELGGSASSSAAEAYPHVMAGAVAEVEFRFACRLLPGTYFLNAGVLSMHSEGETYLHRILDAVAFRVRGEGESKETGIVDFGGGSRVEWEPS